MLGNQKTAVPDGPAQKEMRQVYYTVGAVKFSLMSLSTFGLYKLYWFYRNWQIIRDRDELQISPFWRAFFAPLWTFSMGSHFTKEAKDKKLSLTLPVVALGITYLLMNALWRLPDPYWLVCLLTFLPILPFEFAARRLNGDGQFADPTFGRFSRWNIAWIIIGSILLVLAIVGTFIPESADSRHQGTITERAQSDSVQGVKADDPEMLRAFAKASQTLDGFLARLAANDPAITDPALKIKVQDGDNVEYFWVISPSVTAEGYSGTINNDPEVVRNIRDGQVILFPRSQIYDWTYHDAVSGKTVGNFTACALLTHQSAESSAEFRKTYHLDCAP